LSKLAIDLQRFYEWMESHHYSPSTLKGKRSYLNGFLAWCEGHKLFQSLGVHLRHLEAYKIDLSQRPGRQGAFIKPETVYDNLIAVRFFFKWLSSQNVILYNPAENLILPKTCKPLPRTLTAYQVEKVLNAVDLKTWRGVRDRAVMEVFYSTGIRRSELRRLDVYDIDFAEETLFVNQGKGYKDRLVPIGERALDWVYRYLQEVRPSHVRVPDPGKLFLSRTGRPIYASNFTAMVKMYLEKAGIHQVGACHLFRHAMATLMLENGADVRYIQQMLGHSQIQTTQIYTHVSIAKLRKVYEKTHPFEFT